MCQENRLKIGWLLFYQTPWSTLQIHFLNALRWYSCVFVCLFSEWCTMKWVTQKTSVRIWRSSEWSWRAVIFCWTPVRRLYGRVRHIPVTWTERGGLIAGHFLFESITTPILHEGGSFLFVSLCSTLLVPFSTSWSKRTLCVCLLVLFDCFIYLNDSILQISDFLWVRCSLLNIPKICIRSIFLNQIYFKCIYFFVINSDY